MSSFAQTGLQALLLCSDDKIVRVLRRVLTDLEIGVEHCMHLDAAVQKLTRQRFEAVIVDCTTQEIANKMLRGIRSAPANKRAISLAIINGQKDLKSAFELGAHFVLIKPIALDQTKASFRSVRALMKRERRRHARIAVEIPVKIDWVGAPRGMQVVTADLSENGIAVTSKSKLPPQFSLSFSLPGASAEINCRGELAWEGKPLQGIRFRDLSLEASDQLKAWIARQLMGAEADDPPVACRLSDLSLSACYLETESPFPVRTRLQITMRVQSLDLQVEGIVRVMHPGAGMGVQFSSEKRDQSKLVEKFIHTLVSTEGAVPEVEVKPDTIDNSTGAFAEGNTDGEHADPLLSLFRFGIELPPEDFHAELRKQRGAPQEVGI
ncbi:MAG TPA: PilZ domain-containing protein [Terriglobales bacterium]|nr:PilZ domain-containing protein [Terriglobales bacterium]